MKEKVKVTTSLYTQFLLGSPTNATATMAETTLREVGLHDRITRWLARSKLTPGMLWQQVGTAVNLAGGSLILDDSVLDKPFGPEIGLSRWQYSGTHHKVVHGIGLLTLLWTDGQVAIPVNYRLYDKTVDGKTKHDHAREMLIWAKGVGFQPANILMDGWYAAAQTLRLIQRLGWRWGANLPANRVVIDETGKRTNLGSLNYFCSQRVCKVYLVGVGFVLVAQSDDHQNGRVRYLVLSDLGQPDVCLAYARRWLIEVYHREAKQTTNLAKCQARRSRSQRNHIFCALLAYCALELNQTKTKKSLYQTKLQIILPAVRHYLKHPTISLPGLDSLAVSA